MSQEDVVVDPLAFAREGQGLELRIPVSAVPRLAGEVLGEGGEFAMRFDGRKERDGNLYLVLQVDGEARLTCQRCLEPMDWVCRVRRSEERRVGKECRSRWS